MNTHTHRAEDAPHYMPLTVEHSFRKLPRPCSIDGQLRTRYLAPTVTEYLDVETGEIVPASLVRKRGDVTEIRLGESVLLREVALASLRPEVRRFAEFVLKFRNRRRGITPGIDTLVQWYGQYTGARADNVRRYVPRLFDAGVLVGESVVGPLFQYAGKGVAASSHAGEDERAKLIFADLMLETSAGKSATSVPEWLQARTDAQQVVRRALARLAERRERRSYA
ncbi:hypothetical protein [Paraburkholderia graminis]|uniref:Uncharacterized protein n=1 Tax=Paraburkholderia graminis TaxID=60548 RepID=A0ABD5CNR2_9BURK|nr:hypothetical protein [Paraburkholderia graminis]MDR6206966.1 hypothetical protein [Paraburkholderia graminis]